MLFDYINYKTGGVYGIYGMLGGGKTLTAVQIMKDAVESPNNRVFTNIHMRHLSSEEEGRVTYIDDFSSLSGEDFWNIPTGSPRGSGGKKRTFIVIDEVAEFFDQYSSTSPVLKEFLSWLRHSSKRGQWVFLIVQKPEFIAKSLRLLINWWIVCDDLENFRVPIFRCRLPFVGGFVRRLVYDRNKNLISRGLNLADKRMVGWYYDTSQSIAVAGRSGEEFQVDDTNRPLPLLRLQGFLFLGYILLILFYT